MTDPQLLAASPCAHPAYEHDELGALKMDHEQTQMGLEKPPVQYVDGARVLNRSRARSPLVFFNLLSAPPPLFQAKEGQTFFMCDKVCHFGDRICHGLKLLPDSPPFDEALAPESGPFPPAPH